MANATLGGPRSERLRITCECGKTYRARTKLAGKRIRCKVCKAAVRIPNPDSAPELVVAPAPPALPPELADLPEPEAIAPPVPKSTPKQRSPSKPKPKLELAPSEEATPSKSVPAGLQLLAICLAPALLLGGVKAIAIGFTEPAPAIAAPAKPTYDVNLRTAFAAGEEYTITFVEDSTTRALSRTGARSGVRPNYNRFGRRTQRRSPPSSPLAPLDLRNAYEAVYTSKIQAVDLTQEISAEVRTYERFKNLVTNHDVKVRELQVQRSRQRTAWQLSPPGKTLPTELALALKKEARDDELRLTYRDDARAFSGLKEQVAVDQIFDLDVAPIAPVLGLQPHELDRKRSHCVGRLKAVEERGGKNWLTVAYTIKLVASSYKGTRALKPLIGDYKVTAEFPEGGGGESTLRIEGTFKGRVLYYLIDNALKREVKTVRR